MPIIKCYECGRVKTQENRLGWIELKNKKQLCSSCYVPSLARRHERGN